jgi:uncharacterized repeat protein (TIGR02543 family)
MIPIPDATSYKVYMSPTDGLTDFTGVPCLFSGSTYQPYAYFASGDMDKVSASTPVVISPAATYYFYYVTNDTVVATKYEALTQAAGTSWTSDGNYDTSWYAAGNSPYKISTAAQLAGLAYLVVNGTNFTGETVNLAASVDVSAYPWTPIGSSSKLFQGTFDGQNNVVNVIYINTTADFQGLFGRVYNGNIENLGIVNGFISGSGYVGGVVGLTNASINNCYNTGCVIGSDYCVGGVAGEASSGAYVQNCYNTGSVTDTGACSYYLGGVVGSTDGSVQYCYNTGSVTDTGTRNYCLGGIVGSTNSSVQNCYSIGSVTDTGNYNYCLGGVAGLADTGAAIQDNYYCGYNGGIGRALDNTASDTVGQTTPFVKLASNIIMTNGTTTVAENDADLLNGASNLGADFAVSFGSYSSSNTSAATVSGKTVSGIALGNSNITGTITIIQNNLNMASTSPAWRGTTKTITAAVSMPLTVAAPYSATVKLYKDGTGWTTGTPTIELSTSDAVLSNPVTGTALNGVYSFTGLDISKTYYVWDADITKYTDQSVTNSSTSTVVEYYTVALTKGTGIKTVSGDGAYPKGSDVSISATVTSGYTWSKWTSSGADVSTTQNYTISNITSAVSYTANATAATYALSVTLNGGNGSTVSGSYASGASVSIDAGTRSGCTFGGWTSSDGGTFADASSTSTTFTMPGNETTITASWMQNYTGGIGSTASGNSNTIVIVDGKDYAIGTENKNGSSTTATVDQDKLTDDIATAADNSSTIFPVSANTSVTAQLVVKNIEDMAQKAMTLTVQTGNVSYNLDTTAIDTSKITAALGTTDTGSIPFNVSIANSSAAVNGATVIVEPVEFTITAVYNGKTVSIDIFSCFINRTIAITADQAKQITTAVVVNADEGRRHGRQVLRRHQQPDKQHLHSDI